MLAVPRRQQILAAQQRETGARSHRDRQLQRSWRCPRTSSSAKHTLDGIIVTWGVISFPTEPIHPHPPLFVPLSEIAFPPELLPTGSPQPPTGKVGPSSWPRSSQGFKTCIPPWKPSDSACPSPLRIPTRGGIIIAYRVCPRIWEHFTL